MVAGVAAVSMLHLVCERCGFQVFVETRFDARGWHFKTADSPSLCPACVCDLKLIESTPAPERERIASGKA